MFDKYREKGEQLYRYGYEDPRDVACRDGEDITDYYFIYKAL